MTNQKQTEIALKLDVMIGQLQEAIRAINSGNPMAAGAYMEIVQNQLARAKWQVVRG